MNKEIGRELLNILMNMHKIITNDMLPVIIRFPFPHLKANSDSITNCILEILRPIVNTVKADSEKLRVQKNN